MRPTLVDGGTSLLQARTVNEGGQGADQQGAPGAAQRGTGRRAQAIAHVFRLARVPNGMPGSTGRIASGRSSRRNWASIDAHPVRGARIAVRDHLDRTGRVWPGWTDGTAEEYEGALEIERAWRKGCGPIPPDRIRMGRAASDALDQGIGRARWRTSRTPYLREIMDCLSPASPVERVVLMKGAQVGGTGTGGLNWIGYAIHHAPGPMMAVWPTTEMAQRNSKHGSIP